MRPPSPTPSTKPTATAPTSTHCCRPSPPSSPRPATAQQRPDVPAPRPHGHTPSTRRAARSRAHGPRAHRGGPALRPRALGVVAAPSAVSVRSGPRRSAVSSFRIAGAGRQRSKRSIGLAPHPSGHRLSAQYHVVRKRTCVGRSGALETRPKADDQGPPVGHPAWGATWSG